MNTMEKNKNIPALAVLVLAAAFIAGGIRLHQPGAVLAKAVRICMECVGIG